MHIDLKLLHSCTCVSLVTELLCAHDHSSNAFALAQGCHKQSCICHGSEARLSAIVSGVTWRPSRSAAVAQPCSKQVVATAADLMMLLQQIRQEIADSLQRVREETHTAINGRLDAISSISSAMQGISAGPAESAKPYRINDMIPKSWNGSHDKGQFRKFMAELHLWMQTWSDHGERTLARVESVDKVERPTLAVDCTKGELRTFETALYQILHRTTTNEPLTMVRQVQGQTT